MFPKKYQTQAPAIASYSTSDLAQNTGIQDFYLATTKGGYIITQNQLYSNSVVVSGSTTQTGWTLISDVDYDLTAFNVPQTIRGTAYCTFCNYNASNVDSYIWVKLRKWNSETSTETEIVNMSGSEAIHGATGVYEELMNCIELPISPAVSFKKGEVLRCTVELYCRVTGGTGSGGYGVDPMNRDYFNYITPSTSGNTTQFKLWIPYDLHLK